MGYKIAKENTKNMTNRCFIGRISFWCILAPLLELDSRKATMTATVCSRFVLTSIGLRCSQASAYFLSENVQSVVVVCVEPRSVKADSVF